MTEPRILVAVPTKNNVTSIAEVVTGCLEVTEHVLVINDGSEDGTGQRAEDAGAEVVHHAQNLGKGHAIVTALTWARQRGFTHVVTLDADLQHRASDLPAFFEAIAREPEAIWIGVRDLDSAPESSRFGRRFSNFWIWVETGYAVSDSQSGYRAYPVERVLSLDLAGGHYEFEVQVITRGLWAGLRVLDVPIDVFYPEPEARVSSFDPLWDNVRISLLNTRLVVARLLWPPRWFRARPRGVPSTSQSSLPAWDGRNHGTHWGWHFWIITLRLVGRWPVYICMLGIATWFWLFAGNHRRGLQPYLRRMHPEKSRLGRAWATWNLFFHFAIAIVDRFLLLSVGPSAFRFKVDALHTVIHNLPAGSGYVLMSSHLGNAEVAAAALHDLSLQHPEIDRPIHVLRYVAPNDPYIDLAHALHPESSPAVIALNDSNDMAALRATRALRAGGVVALKADRLVDERTTEVPFLGQDMPLPTGPFWLAALSKSPVILVGCVKEDSRTYRLLTHGPMDYQFASRKTRESDIQKWAAAYAQQLEQWARKYPAQWYNFHDVWDRRSALGQIPSFDRD